KKDHKIIAVATEDPTYNTFHETTEMPPHTLQMLRRFFEDYKQLEGKVVAVDDILPAKEGYDIVQDALERYSHKRRGGYKF
ncbi:MAG TPA: inorganic diphosphatase, partial [bacterium]|nr:inorganic diphosphatase [bacterium]